MTTEPIDPQINQSRTTLNIDQITTIINAPTKRLLIVDDEPYNMMALQTILTHAEKLLLTELYGREIMDKSDSRITDLIDRASNG